MSIPNLLAFFIVVVFMTAVVWAARILLVDIELQQAVHAAVESVASDGCWDAPAMQAWNRAVGVYPLSTVASQIHTLPATTFSYTGYGQLVTVEAQVSVPFWLGQQTSNGSSTITLTATRQAVSLAPTVDLSTSCQTPPGFQG
ncbi:hypothetical protein [Sulfobacillus thermosulfidooxidans]|uniref:hypothetical protein n=1 Tax=Sulfobacillus thermosulfidooxidans TaxID=28034 RepID=UPI0006B67C96|nr:hypothetical protein [Sulfobacillus thermosulfidooxidans]